MICKGEDGSYGGSFTESNRVWGQKMLERLIPHQKLPPGELPEHIAVLQSLYRRQLIFGV